MKWGRQRGTEGGRCNARDERFVELTMPSPQKREDLGKLEPRWRKTARVRLGVEQESVEFHFFAVSVRQGRLSRSDNLRLKISFGCEKAANGFISFLPRSDSHSPPVYFGSLCQNNSQHTMSTDTATTPAPAPAAAASNGMRKNGQSPRPSPRPHCSFPRLTPKQGKTGMTPARRPSAPKRALPRTLSGWKLASTMRPSRNVSAR